MIVVGVVTHEIVWFRGSRLLHKHLSRGARVGVARDRPWRADVLSIGVVLLVRLMGMTCVHRVGHQGVEVGMRSTSFIAATVALSD